MLRGGDPAIERRGSVSNAASVSDSGVVRWARESTLDGRTDVAFWALSTTGRLYSALITRPGSWRNKAVAISSSGASKNWPITCNFFASSAAREQ